MPEGGFFQRVFGRGEGQDAEEAGAPSDPVAAALAMDVAHFDPVLAAKAASYLERQGEFVSIQTEHLHEQRQVQLDNLKLRRTSERLRVAIQVLVALFGLPIVSGLGLMIWKATQDHALVVEPFSVPSDFVANGLSGQVVAQMVLDRLADLQAQTLSSRPAGSYRDDWHDGLKVEIPETGVSLADLRTFLDGELGHETRISGETFQTPSGLTVTARVGDEAASRFSGTPAELDTLVQDAAEVVYRRTQPYRYAFYLRQHGRLAEAAAIFGDLLEQGSRTERAWAHVGLGFVRRDQKNNPDYAAENKLALALEHGFAPALLNLEAAELQQGHDAAGVAAGRAFLAAKSSIRRDLAEPYRSELVDDEGAWMENVAGDIPRALASSADLMEIPLPPGMRNAVLDERASALTAAHDPDTARQVVAGITDDQERTTLLGLIAASEDDPSAVALLRRSIAGTERDFGWAVPILGNKTAWLALAQARSGDVVGAATTIQATPLDCTLCIRVRGSIASLAGRRAEAEHWFAIAVEQAPDLPQAYVDRGEARLRAGDVDGALADAGAAVRHGGGYPDAAKLLGDVQAKQGRWHEALDRYRAALALAPAWAAARQAEDAAARHV